MTQLRKWDPFGWRYMRTLADDLERQHDDIERCERGEMEWIAWLRKYRPELAAQFGGRP